MSLADKVYRERLNASRRALERQARQAGILRDGRYIGAGRYAKRRAAAPGSEAARVKLLGLD